MDKQPPLGEWRSGLGPYEPVREGDVLYGRGTADDGYSTFAAVTGLLAAGGGHGRVLILIEASEESGSPDLAAHLDNLRDRIGTPPARDLPRLGRPQLRPPVADDVAAGRCSWPTSGWTCSPRASTAAQGGGVVPSSFRILRRILSNIEDEATGRILLPELQGAGIPAVPPGQHRGAGPGVPRQRRARWSRGCTCSRPTRSTGSSPAPGAPPSRSRGRTACPSRTGRRQRAAPVDHAQALAAATARRRRPGGVGRADLGHPHRRGSAHHDRPRGGRPGLDRAAAGPRTRLPRSSAVSRSASGATSAPSARAAPSRSCPTCRRASRARRSWPPGSSARIRTRTGPTRRCTSRWPRP